MARCYSAGMERRQPRLSAAIRRPDRPAAPLPAIWLVSDARNDAALEATLRRLPRGSGLIFRHYHLDTKARRARFAELARLARRRRHWVVLAGTPRTARAWGADGVYAPPERLRRRSAQHPRGLRLTTAHGLREIAAAARVRPDAILLSPVFATRSHPGARALGPLRFRLLAARAPTPVVALGGMTPRRARRLGVRHWAAIDGLHPARV